MGENPKKRKAKPSSGGRLEADLRRRRRKPVARTKPEVKGGKFWTFVGKKPPVKKAAPKKAAPKKPAKKSVQAVSIPARRKPPAKKTPAKKPAKKSVQRVRIPDPAVLAARIAREQAQAQYKRAVAKFKPKKSELGTVVFLSARPPKGRSQRLERSSRRKGYAVYITKSGKVEPLRERKGDPPVPRKRASVDPAKFRRKAAREAGQKAAFASISSRRALGRTLTPQGNRTSVDWLRVEAQLAGAMSLGMRTEKRAHTQVVRHQVVVRTKDGAMRTFTATTNLHVSDQQAQMDPGPQWSGFSGKINEAYSLIAEQLKAANMVSQGSADYISELDINEGVDDQQMWLGEDGSRWEKNECDVVDIVSWSFEVGVGVIEG